MDPLGPTEGAEPRSEATATPDVMNDPTFDIDSARDQKSTEDADTCRICRGEGSKEEPLFYPCKCSGSIKFVHQNCLMEWLSHSQKKHCELCKIPFRFTKLYSPQMPNTVPLPVFLRQAALQAYRSLLTWSRFQLVVFVWVAWLPWSMRSIWRGLFWFGDGGWVAWQEAEKRAISAAQAQLDRLAAEGTTPAGLSFFTSKENVAGAMVSHMANAIPHFLSPVSSTLNYSGGPLLFRLGKRLLRTVIGRATNGTSQGTTVPSPTNYTSNPSMEIYAPSMLSDTIFLKTLTRYPKVNRILIDMLEGQLITLFVVVIFILTFLIREWVVQQQPGINLAAAAEAENQEAGNVPALQQLARQHAQQHLPQAREGHPAAEDDREPQPADARQPRILARPRQRRGQHPLAQVVQAQSGDASEAGDQMPTDEWSETATTGDEDRLLESSDTTDSNTTIISPAPQRPSMPTRNTLRQAAEIRRVLEEQAQASGQQDWPGLKIFTDLWTRAEREPSEVLKIIDQEGRNQELGWIVAFMRRLEKIPAAEGDIHEVLRPEKSIASEDNRESQCLILPFASEEMQKPIVNLPENLDDEFWPSADTQASNIEDENNPYPSPKSSPLLAAEIKMPGLIIGSEREPIGLRDISNQQLDGAVSSSSSIHNHQVETSDLGSGFVVVSSNTQNAQISMSSPPNTPPLPHTDNPFHPDYRETPETQVAMESRADGTQEILDHIEEQGHHMTRLLDDRNAIVRNASDHPTETHVDEAADNSTPNPAPATNAPRSYVDIVMDWLWGEVIPPVEPPQVQGMNDEHIVENIDEEAPFVPVAHGQHVIEEANDQNAAEPVQDAEIRAAALQAGLDPNDVEAVEDAEDLEGIMELVGMQGPMIGLIQNGMFCAVIVSLTIFLGIWTPYIVGKFFLVFLANPVSLLVKMPLRWASSFADLTIDLFIFSTGCSYYWLDIAVRFLCSPIGLLVPTLGRISQNGLFAEAARGYAESALDRLVKGFVVSSGSFLESDIPTFSVIAHESLQNIQNSTSDRFRLLVDSIVVIGNGTSIIEVGRNLLAAGVVARKSIVIDANYYLPTMSDLEALARSLVSINPLKLDLSTAQRSNPLDYTLANWDTKDRAIAIVLGYLAFGLTGAVYLKISSFLRGKNDVGKIDGPVADVLYQAGGVLKVILIISIEMIVFPLFCGLLLDVALLPLFGSATMLSRLRFSLKFPWTSLFVHWFVGTCYMFHLALFASMCRKIMRTGVLYFIRDPDDPTFHPVRDVLERSIITQFRKIIFSAVVYGGLVMICLGGVVWGLYYAFDGVFPIHWSSNEPVLEFPVDLLFYNLLMPVAVKFFRPSNLVNETYSWWLRKCARGLRLSHFLFNDKKEDEEGHHVHRTWKAFFTRKRGDPLNPVVGDDRRLLAEDRDTEAYFLRDGRYVRTPASDQVRMPRGARTFLDVDEDNNRLDGLDDSETGLHGRANDHFTKVYVPPSFRLRISVFIFLIWVFAATTGVGITILPLVLGRYLFTKFAPRQMQMNDIYAFSIGIYLLGGLFYAALHAPKLLIRIRTALTPPPNSPTATYLHHLKTYTSSTLRVLYTYTTFLVLLSTLSSLLIECYLIIPLHTYLATPDERHTIHFVQDWTLGILYLKTLGRLILWNTPSRPAAALRAIVRNGWLDPDARLATRAFIFPATVLILLALGVPLALGWVANVMWCRGSEDAVRVAVYRYSYPAVLAAGLVLVGGWGARKVFEGWRGRIRDEVYLIGERLHNFGESRRVKGGVVRGAGRVETR